MAEPRIELLSLEETAAIHTEVGVAPEKAFANIYRTLMHKPKFGFLINELVELLLTESTLEPRLRELVIMRIGWLNKGAYEWTHHWRLALGDGVAESDLLAMRNWQASDQWSPKERALFSATDESLASGTVSDETMDECVKHFASEQELIDAMATISVWDMISRLLITLRVPLEEIVEAWPPDGEMPA